MKVWFENKYDEMKLMGIADDREDVFNIIHEFLLANHIKSYYYNMCYIPEDNMTFIDYGSHSEFIYVEGNIME